MTSQNDSRAALNAVNNLHLTTMGRSTGLARRVELWFAYDEGCIYLMAGSTEDGRPNHWYRNLQANPSARVEIAGESYSVTMEPVEDPEAARSAIRELFRAKFGQEIMDRFYYREGLIPVRLKVEDPIA